MATALPRGTVTWQVSYGYHSREFDDRDVAVSGVHGHARLTIDPVELSDTTGRTLQYRVVARTSCRKSALPDSIFRTDGPAALTLVTCGGPFDSRTHHYRDNIVVSATPTAP